MSIASRIEAIEQHLTDDYNVLEVAGADLTNVNKNILNLKSTWQERLLYFINNGTDVVWNNWDKVTGEGTILTLNNTEEAPMKINLKGNTSQETAILPSEYTQVDYIESTGTQYIDTGVKLSPDYGFDIKFLTNNDLSATVYGCIFGGRNGSGVKDYQLTTFALNDTPKGTLRWGASTGGNIANANITLNTAQQCSLKNKTFTSCNGTVTQLTTTVEQSDYNCFLFGLNNGTSGFSQSGNGCRIYYCKFYDGNNLIRNFVPCYRNSDNEVGLYDLVNNVFYTNAGTGAFTYGAVATLPNPDYPQDIHVVSGDNSIDVNTKNLYNATKEQWTYRNVTASADNQRLYFNGTISTAGSMNFPEIFVKAGTYTLSAELESGSITSTGTSGNAGLLLYIYSTSGGNGSFATLRDDHPRSSRVVTFTQDTYMYIHAYPRPAETMTNAVIKYQVVKGDTADYDFVPYQSQSYPITLPEGMFLGWIPNTDYRDIIFQAKTGDTYYDSLDSTTKESLTYGKWYLNKQIGKYKITGQESGSVLYWNNEINGMRLKLDNAINTIANAPLFCNRFKAVQGTSQDNNYVRLNRTTGENYIGFWFGNVSIEGVNNEATFKTYASSNDIILSYPLNTPTYTEITDSTLLSQLEVVKLSYEGQTNISQTNNDLPFIINATALKEMA